MSSLQRQTAPPPGTLWSQSPPIRILPPHNGTEASKAGARAAQPRASTECAEVYAILSDGPRTSAEIGERLNLPRTTIDARLNDLKAKGLAEKIAGADGKVKRQKSRFADGSESKVRHQVWRSV